MPPRVDPDLSRRIVGILWETTDRSLSARDVAHHLGNQGVALTVRATFRLLSDMEEHGLTAGALGGANGSVWTLGCAGVALKCKGFT